MKPSIFTRLDYGISQLIHYAMTGEWWKGNIQDFMRLPR